MIAKRRGSQSLAGASLIRFRVPAVSVPPTVDIAHSVEQQPHKLFVTGSNPVIQPDRCSKQRLQNQ